MSDIAKEATIAFKTAAFAYVAMLGICPSFANVGHAGMQALALLTWREGACLADALGDKEFSARCRRTAARFETLRGKLEPHGSKQAAAMLALSRLRDPKEMFKQVFGQGGAHGMSTFYGYYMLEAMSAAGAMALPGGGAVRIRVERKEDGSLKIDVNAPNGVEVAT